MEEKLDGFSERVDDKFSYLTALIEKHIENQDSINKENDGKYASKWVQTGAIWFGGFVLTSAIALICALISYHGKL